MVGYDRGWGDGGTRGGGEGGGGVGWGGVDALLQQGIRGLMGDIIYHKTAENDSNSSFHFNSVNR